MSELENSVSVVIPTTGRASLIHSLRSAAEQDASGQLEVIVAADMSHADNRADFVVRAASEVGIARVLFTGGGAGGAGARNLGVKEATGKWIAFLDDDDLWDRSKIRVQLDYARLQGLTAVSSRSWQFESATGRELITGVPETLISPGDDIADYLFSRRQASPLRNSLFTSTLLIRSDVAKTYEWDSSLERHQDWDWLLGLSRDQGFRIAHHPHRLVGIAVGSPASISASSNWRASLAWADRVLLQRNNSQVYVDFVAAQPLRYALQGRSLVGVRQSMLGIARGRRLPSASCIVIGMSGVLPRKVAEQLLRRKEKSRVEC